MLASQSVFSFSGWNEAVEHVNNCLAERKNLIVERCVFDSEWRSVRNATIGDTLHLNKVWNASCSKLRIGFNLGHVELFDQGQAEDSTIGTLSECINGCEETLPIILKSHIRKSCE